MLVWFRCLIIMSQLFLCNFALSASLSHAPHVSSLSLRPPQVLQSTLQCDILQSEPAILVTWHFLHQSQSVTSRGALTGVVLIQHNGTTHCSSAVGIFHPSRYSELGLWETHVTICWTPCSSSNGKHDVINAHSIMTWRHHYTLLHTEPKNTCFTCSVFGGRGTLSDTTLLSTHFFSPDTALSTYSMYTSVGRPAGPPPRFTPPFSSTSPASHIVSKLNVVRVTALAWHDCPGPLVSNFTIHGFIDLLVHIRASRHRLNRISDIIEGILKFYYQRN